MAGMVTHWLTEAGRWPIPTPEQQILLGKAIKRSQQPDATAREKRQGQRAKERLIRGNLRLVVSVSKSYSRALSGCHGLEIADLLQEGAIGLQRAAEKFDFEKGYKFSTYATWWIRQGMGRLLSYSGRMIRVPCSTHDLLRRWRHRPTGQSLEDFAAFWDYSPAKVLAELEQAEITDCVSTDARVRNHDDHGALIELLAAPEPPDNLEQLREQLEWLAKLDPEGLDLLTLHKEQGHTRAEIAEAKGWSSNEVRKYLDSAKARFRQTAGAGAQQLLAS